MTQTTHFNQIRPHIGTKPLQSTLYIQHLMSKLCFWFSLKQCLNGNLIMDSYVLRFPVTSKVLMFLKTHEAKKEGIVNV